MFSQSDYELVASRERYAKLFDGLVKVMIPVSIVMFLSYILNASILIVMIEIAILVVALMSVIILLLRMYQAVSTFAEANECSYKEAKTIMDILAEELNKD